MDSKCLFCSSCLLKIVALSMVFVGCATTQPVPGPDKQFVGGVGGAAVGAGAGAVTGFQLASATGPGAAIGAGFGAVAGGIQGYIEDQNEDQLLRLSDQANEEKKRAWAQEVLAEYYKNRMALHPTREIYPADLFFRGDDTELRPYAGALLSEIASMNKERLSWSTLVVASYVKANDPESEWAKHLAEERAKNIGDALARSGIEARRIQARAVIISNPLVIDPHDNPNRYNQAVEIIPLDR